MTTTKTTTEQPASDGESDPSTPRRPIWNWWSNPPHPRVVAALSRRVYVYDFGRRDALRRYFALLVLAVPMATFGLHKDSATIVLSAMLLEQMMIPIVALSLSLVTGEPRRQLVAAIVIASSALMAIALSWLVSALVLSDRTHISNQVIANSSPNLSDLVVALVAGAAGAYVLIHREALGALPGAAVGLALVPPLCATGYLLANGERSMANGAMLMFITNLAAIIFASAAVFVLAGFLPVRQLGGLPTRVKVGIVSATLAVGVLIVPLQGVTRSIIQDARDEAVVLDITNEWVEGTTFKVVGVSVEGDTVQISLSGPTTPETIDDLAREIAASLGRPIQLELEVFNASSITIEGSPD